MPDEAEAPANITQTSQPPLGGPPLGQPREPAKIQAGAGRPPTSSALDTFFFIFAGAASVWLAVLVFEESFSWGWGVVWVIIIFWVLSAYLVLPRLHRILTRIYLPDYFIGRARTSDGLLGDPVNLALTGTEAQLHQVLTEAGWTRADDITAASTRRIITSTLSRRSYDEAPVSPLLLFDRQQDFAYQQEVAGNPAKRHHVRFWRCPDGWALPGGGRVDWLAAGTFDKRVGFSLFTLQITHKIDENTDIERDHIVASLSAADPAVSVAVIRDFSTGYHSRNGGGDSIETDGDLPVINLRDVQVTDAAPPAAASGAVKKPQAIVVGAALMGARVLAGLLFIGVTAVNWREVADSLDVDLGRSGITGAAAHDLVLATVLIVYGLALLAYLVVAWFVFVGHNWARVTAMAMATISIVIQLASSLTDGVAITLRTTLVSLALDILILLALSASSARTYARRRRER
ncbi:LssY C-terminal domain-containing protein [Leifsonia kafniensis]|uniref:LssY C-terminal domain-containing protein n=1 Tax=Leifsonia kafniensis TaxID=475957 RepID=A0ABP7KYH6_9MICO